MGKHRLLLLSIIGMFILVPPRLLAQLDSVAAQVASTSESVLLEADFKKLSCQNVGDALKHLAGVYVRNGQVALRDVAADKVVIFFDGQRLNTAQGGGVDIVNLPIDNVERIEVIRGGSSALYGADAVGGVIKITSKSRSTESAQSSMNANVSAAIGSFSERIGSIGLSQTLGEFSYFVNYKRYLTDGDFEYADPNTSRRETWINNDQASHDVFVKAAFAPGQGINVSAAGGYYSADVGAPGLINQLTPRARLRYDNKNLNFNYDNADVFRGFNLKVQSYYHFFETRYDEPDGLVPIHSKHNNDAYALELQQSGSLFENTQVAYGYTFRQDRIESSDIGSKKRNNHAAYATATVTIKDLGFAFDEFSVSPAARYDYPSDFSAEWSPKISLSFQKNGELRYTLTSHLARSYRAPTFNDLYWPRDSYAEGNPNLSPERGVNYDIGISISYPLLGEVSFTSNYFVNLIDNLILWAPGSGGLWRPTNISKTDARGIETGARWKPWKEYIEIGADYTYMAALDKSSSLTTRDKDLIYRPRNKVDATVTARYEKVEVNVVLHYVGKRYTNASNTLRLPAYQILDANVSYGMAVSSLYLTGKFELMNLMDESIMITDGSPIPGRAFRLTIGCSI